MQKYRCSQYFLLLMLTTTLCSSSVAQNYASVGSKYSKFHSFESNNLEEKITKMKLEIDKQFISVVLYENSSVDALKELLANGPLTLHMTDYEGMEKCADLGRVLPQNNVLMHTQAGDIILYQGKTLVIYYDTNTWNLTPIGKIENVEPDQLRQVLGTGYLTVTFSLE